MRLIFSILLLMLLLLPLVCSVSAEGVEDELMEGIDPEEGVSDEVKEEIGAFSEKGSSPILQTIGKLLRGAVASSGILSFRSGLRTAAIILAASLSGSLPDKESVVHRGVDLACTFVIVTACASDLHGMIGLGVETVEKIAGYAVALIPGLCTLLVASGGPETAAAVQIASAGALELFCSVCVRLVVPLIYLFIGLSAAEAALGMGTLDKLRDFVKWLCSSALKWTVSLFTGLLALIGCFSGAADASKLRAARFIISGMIPMVGGAVSGASESLINAAGMLRSTVGVYGMTAVLGLFFAPFLKIAAQYLILKIAGAVSGLLGSPSQTGLVERMTQAMGLVLAMTGVVCIMTLFSFALCVKSLTG